MNSIGLAFRCAVLAVGAWLLATAPGWALVNEPVILTYHEIAEPADALTPDYAIAPGDFAKEIAWLRQQGYRFISADALLKARQEARALPAKSVLLTFDDGYRSAYRNAFPLLIAQHIPFVVAIVGSWEQSDGPVDFSGKLIPRDAFMSWGELQELHATGLAEIASHTFDLHRGIAGNPQGNLEPAASTRAWRDADGRYETEPEYIERVKNDLKRNRDLIEEHIGAAPRVIVWPYGRYTERLGALADELGMKIGLNLDDGPNNASTPLWRMRRLLMGGRAAPADFEREVARRESAFSDNDRPQKVTHIDLDYIYDPDPAQQERNLSHLLDRIQSLYVNTVYLQAFSDVDGDGVAEGLYFPNRRMPMRADLFNRVAWQIKTRTQVRRVYAWMPLLAFKLPDADPAASERVVTLRDERSGRLAPGYARLSPFSALARQAISDIYEDLARAATFEGVLFHDDALLTDFEDASEGALEAYRAWGLPASIKDIRSKPALMRQWTARKIEALDGFAMDMAEVLRREQPSLITARNLYARVVLDGRSEAWYSQSLRASLAKYDFTAIEAMPRMEGFADRERFYQTLVKQVRSRPNGLRKTVFELQTVDWSKGSEPIPTQELVDTVKYLYDRGVLHVAYYPDQLFKNQPDWSALRHVFALR